MFSSNGMNKRSFCSTFPQLVGWSGGAMALDKLPVPGRPTIWMIVGQGPIALAVGGAGCCLDIFTLLYPFSPLSPSLWETLRYKLRCCLKGPLNPKQQQQPQLACCFILLHGPSMFAVRPKIYGVLYNQASSIAFDETSSYWSALKRS